MMSTSVVCLEGLGRNSELCRHIFDPVALKVLLNLVQYS